MEPESPFQKAMAGGMRQFRFADIIVDERTQTIERAGNTSSLTGLTWQFLLVLISHAPETVAYETLADEVWQSRHVSDETMAQRVRHLRQALGDDPKAPTYVRTVRGVGYQVIPEVITLSPKSADSLPSREHDIPRTTLARYVIFGLLSIGFLAVWLIEPYRSNSENRAASTQSTRALAGISTPVAERLARARDYSARGHSASNEVAIGLYQEVLQLEADNVDALIGLSLALSQKTAKYESSASWADQASQLADRALTIAPQNAQAWAARGFADDARGRVSAALRSYRQAQEHSPGDQAVRTSISYLLQVQGKLHAALQMETEALRQSSPSYFADYQIAVALELAELKLASNVWLDRARTLRPDNVFLKEYEATLAMESGHPGRALHILREQASVRLSRPIQTAILSGFASQSMGNLEAANSYFASAKQVSDQLGRPCYECVAVDVSITNDNVLALELLKMGDVAIAAGEEWPEFRVQRAYLFAAMGDYDGAMDELTAAQKLGYRRFRWLQRVFLLAELQEDPGFKQLVVAMQQDVARERSKILADPELSALLTVAIEID